MAVQSTAHANAYAERLIGSIRRKCLDHIIVANERGLRRALDAYVKYYLKCRTLLSLDKDAPVSRPRDTHRRRDRRDSSPRRSAPPLRMSRRITRLIDGTTRSALFANGIRTSIDIHRAPRV
jgi:hypothetical protein